MGSESLRTDWRMPKDRFKQTTTTEEPVITYGVPRSGRPAPESAASSSSKRKLNGEKSASNIPPEPSLGERLQKDLGAVEEIVDPGPPKADNLSILLEQGLKSSDNSLLQSVLSRCDEALIRKTIELLPLQYTVPLIQVLFLLILLPGID